MPVLRYKFPEPTRWTAKELRDACVYFYGPHWRKALAADTGYSKAAIATWCTHKHPVPLVVKKYVRLLVQMKAVLTQSPVIPYSKQ